MPTRNPVRWTLFSLFACLTLVVAGSAGAMEVLDRSGQDDSNKDYSNRNLDKSNFSDAVCINTGFFNTSLKQVNFKGANLKDAKFMHGADCTGADFTGSTGKPFFVDVNLSKANLQGVTFTLGNKVKLLGTNMQKATIFGNFNGAVMTGADLRGTNLRGTKIYGEEAKILKGAFYNDDTAFPDSFDPKEAGMIFKEADKKNDGKKDKPGR